jgi:hypothetical protein
MKFLSDNEYDLKIFAELLKNPIRSVAARKDGELNDPDTSEAIETKKIKALMQEIDARSVGFVENFKKAALSDDSLRQIMNKKLADISSQDMDELATRLSGDVFSDSFSSFSYRTLRGGRKIKLNITLSKGQMLVDFRDAIEKSQQKPEISSEPLSSFSKTFFDNYVPPVSLVIENEKK